MHLSWTDITTIRRLMQMNQAVFECARSPMVVADEKGVILQANQIMSEVFGYEQSELVGSNVTILMPSGMAEQHGGFMARYEKGSRLWWKLGMGMGVMTGCGLLVGSATGISRPARSG